MDANQEYENLYVKNDVAKQHFQSRASLHAWRTNIDFSFSTKKIRQFCLYWCYWAHLFLTYSYHANACLVAEIPDNKGKISYCEKHSYANVTWPTTLPSQTALAPCPTNSRGTCSRFISSVDKPFFNIHQQHQSQVKTNLWYHWTTWIQSLNSPMDQYHLYHRVYTQKISFYFVIRHCQESMRESCRW